MTGNLNNDLPSLKLNLGSKLLKTFANICNSKSNYKIWHKRLGHISASKFNQLKNKNMIFEENLINSIKTNDECCEACICGKQAFK